MGLINRRENSPAQAIPSVSLGMLPKFLNSHSLLYFQLPIFIFQHFFEPMLFLEKLGSASVKQITNKMPRGLEEAVGGAGGAGGGG